MRAADSQSDDKGIYVELEAEGDDHRVSLFLKGPGPYRIALGKDGWKILQRSGEAQNIGEIVLPSDAWYHIATDFVDAQDAARDWKD